MCQQVAVSNVHLKVVHAVLSANRTASPQIITVGGGREGGDRGYRESSICLFLLASLPRHIYVLHLRMERLKDRFIYGDKSRTGLSYQDIASSIGLPCWQGAWG